MPITRPAASGNFLVRIIKPDLVLIYRQRDADNLELVRPGSHGELGP
jgi:mRNA-degrading endonuclease YafQ of YafQ-DinJ toxin-antitoxin module